MPVAPTYPGVYVEEIPSGVRTIVGVATSITAFIGRALRGPTDTAVTINNFGDFERIFGGLWVESSLGFAVRDFYLNGGSQAIIVRLYRLDARAPDAARAVADAAIGADAAAVAASARAKADTFPSDPEKTAAAAVATAAETEAAKAGATAQQVKDAAKAEADKAVGPATKAKLSVSDIKLAAAYEGRWGSALRATVDQDQISEDVATSMNLLKADLFNLTVREDSPGGATERFLNLTTKPSARQINNVLKEDSKLVKWDGDYPTTPPVITVGSDAVTTKWLDWQAKKKIVQDKINSGATPAQAELDAANTAKTTYDAEEKAARDAVSDGLPLTIANFLPDKAQTNKLGLYSLEQVLARDGLFNILCIPPYLAGGDVDPALLSEAVSYCERRRAMLIVDPPSGWDDKTEAHDGFTDPNSTIPRSRNAALYFPRLLQPNPLRNNQMEEFVPCGVVAGIFARTDTQRGVWKAPAGLDATLVGVPQLSSPLTDEENGELNPLGINCLRAFPIAGRVIWGSRTLRGADQLADEYKYVPVRRLALYIEESLFRGLKWVVFEPNDEPLWAQIRLNVGAFMHNLFRQGAFQGSTPRDAYFVKCDKETTTQNDINLGIVNVVVGFAPLKPAEFVIIKLQQMAGQIQT
jgi:Bacteriophage tail sheath protein